MKTTKEPIKEEGDNILEHITLVVFIAILLGFVFLAINDLTAKRVITKEVSCVDERGFVIKGVVCEKEIRCDGMIRFLDSKECEE
jgi:hypothetical protein